MNIKLIGLIMIFTFNSFLFKLTFKLAEVYRIRAEIQPLSGSELAFQLPTHIQGRSAAAAGPGFAAPHVILPVTAPIIKPCVNITLRQRRNSKALDPLLTQ